MDIIKTQVQLGLMFGHKPDPSNFLATQEYYRNHNGHFWDAMGIEPAKAHPVFTPPRHQAPAPSPLPVPQPLTRPLTPARPPTFPEATASPQPRNSSSRAVQQAPWVKPAAQIENERLEEMFRTERDRLLYAHGYHINTHAGLFSIADRARFTQIAPDCQPDQQYRLKDSEKQALACAYGIARIFIDNARDNPAMRTHLYKQYKPPVQKTPASARVHPAERGATIPVPLPNPLRKPRP